MKVIDLDVQPFTVVHVEGDQRENRKFSLISGLLSREGGRGENRKF